MKKMGYSSLVSSSTTKSGTSLIISETVFRTQLFPNLVLMGHFGQMIQQAEPKSEKMGYFHFVKTWALILLDKAYGLSLN